MSHLAKLPNDVLFSLVQYGHEEEMCSLLQEAEATPDDIIDEIYKYNPNYNPCIDLLKVLTRERSRSIRRKQLEKDFNSIPKDALAYKLYKLFEEKGYPAIIFRTNGDGFSYVIDEESGVSRSDLEHLLPDEEGAYGQWYAYDNYNEGDARIYSHAELYPHLTSDLEKIVEMLHPDKLSVFQD